MPAVPDVPELFQQPGPQGLARKLGLLDATTLIVGSMIGSGIFIAPSLMAKNISAPGLYLGLWVLGGVFTLLGAFSYGELSAMMPHAGGQYVFLRRALGRLLGFLYGWTLLLVIQSGFCAAVSLAFAKYLGVFVPGLGEGTVLLQLALPAQLGTLSISTAQLCALAVLAFLTWINTRGVEAGAWVQNLFTILKVGAVLLLVLLGFALGKGSMRHFSPLWSTEVPHPPGAVQVGFLAALGVAMSKALFSYDAWNTVTFAAAEVRDPGRNLPRALVLGTAATTLTYTAAAAVYLYLVPLERMATVPENRIAAEAARVLFGEVGTQLVAGAILISTFGCINGMILGGARVLYAMACDRLFFAAASRTNERQVPHIALVLLGLWSGVLALSGRYDDLLTYTTFASLLFNALTVLALFLLRHRLPDVPRPYRAWGYPVTPALFLIISLLFVVYIVQGDPRSSLYGLLLVLLGVPIYVAMARRGAPRPAGH
ncbi:MAG: amino acid permease [Myxococcales bacterium]|nr:amino acid permease [Myxococcota bacterium]MDW8281346.1 amino acid permease [Myxococcales bacterium]